MKIFECKECGANCKVFVDGLVPKYCLYDKEDIDWHEVVDSAENEQFGNSEQLPSNPRKLPDWVKVGGYMYLPEKGKYFKITEDFMNVNLIGEKLTAILYGKIVQARKRPFNEAEMKALVGKVIEDNRNNISLVTDYDFFTKRIRIHGEYLNNNDLIDYDITVNGKPCYKLEHLENGEWVE